MALAFVPPENPPTPNSATGKPLHAGFWLGENLPDCLRFGGRGLGGLGLGGRGLGHPCESPLGNLATVRFPHPGLVPDFGAKKGPILSKLCLMGWSWEAWGLVREGFGQVLTKVLQVLAKGFPIFYV